MAANEQFYEEISRAINVQRAQVAEDTVTRYYAARPDLLTRYGAAGRMKCLQDVNYHLSYLAQALQYPLRSSLSTMWHGPK